MSAKCPTQLISSAPLIVCLLLKNLVLETWSLIAPIENTCIFSHATTLQKSIKKQEVQYYSRADWDKLKRILGDGDLCSLIQNASSVNDAWLMWRSAFMGAVFESIPRKSIKIKNSTPWMSRRLQRLIQLKGASFRMWKRTINNQHEAKFKQLRTKVRKAVALPKHEHAVKLFEDCRNPAEFWSTVCSFTKEKTELPSLVSENGTFTANNKEKIIC